MAQNILDFGLKNWWENLGGLLMCFYVGQRLLQSRLVVLRLLVSSFVIVRYLFTTDPALGLLPELGFVSAVIFSVVGSFLFGFRFIRHILYIMLNGFYSLGPFGVKEA